MYGYDNKGAHLFTNAGAATSQLYGYDDSDYDNVSNDVNVPFAATTSQLYGYDNSENAVAISVKPDVRLRQGCHQRQTVIRQQRCQGSVRRNYKPALWLRQQNAGSRRGVTRSSSAAPNIVVRLPASFMATTTDHVVCRVCQPHSASQLYGYDNVSNDVRVPFAATTSQLYGYDNVSHDVRVPFAATTSQLYGYDNQMSANPSSAPSSQICGYDKVCSQICGYDNKFACRRAFLPSSNAPSTVRPHGAATSQMYGYDKNEIWRRVMKHAASFMATTTQLPRINVIDTTRLLPNCGDYAANYAATTKGIRAQKRITTKQPMQPALWLRQQWSPHDGGYHHSASFMATTTRRCGRSAPIQPASFMATKAT